MVSRETSRPGDKDEAVRGGSRAEADSSAYSGRSHLTRTNGGARQGRGAHTLTVTQGSGKGAHTAEPRIPIVSQSVAREAVQRAKGTGNRSVHLPRRGVVVLMSAPRRLVHHGVDCAELQELGRRHSKALRRLVHAGSVLPQDRGAALG